MSQMIHFNYLISIKRTHVEFCDSFRIIQFELKFLDSIKIALCSLLNVSLKYLPT